MDTIWRLRKHSFFELLSAKIQTLVRRFILKVIKSQMGHSHDWFEKLHTKLHINGKDYLLRMSPLSALVFTNDYGAGNLSASLRLESDTSMYPSAPLHGPDLANLTMPRSGAVIALHEDQSNSLISTFLTNMGDININLTSKSMPPINWTPLFTGETSEIRFRDGRFYLRIKSRFEFNFNDKETTCEGSIPISGHIRP